MFAERSLRRPNFLDGAAIPLADGGLWTVPLPGASGQHDRPHPMAAEFMEALGPHYLDALEAVRDAEDRTEVLRAELALAICLLRHNYDLDPPTLSRLLTFANRDALRRMQHAMAAVASAHLRAFRPRREQPRKAFVGWFLRSAPLGAYSPG